MGAMLADVARRCVLQIVPEQASACATRPRLDVAAVRVTGLLVSRIVSPSRSPVHSVFAKPSLGTFLP